MCCMQSPQLARAVRLLSNVSQAASDDRRRLVADIETISLYNWLNQHQMAAVYVTATEEWLSQTDLSQTCCRQYTEFLIIKAEMLLLNKKVMWSSLHTCMHINSYRSVYFRLTTDLSFWTCGMVHAVHRNKLSAVITLMLTLTLAILQQPCH